jgi:hypothetical protein
MRDEMAEKEVERIEKIINEAVESAWEEAKLRDLINLYLMWKKGELQQFKDFDALLERFFNYDDRVREMNEKDYCMLEGAVVEAICNCPQGIHTSLCKQKDED